MESRRRKKPIKKKKKKHLDSTNAIKAEFKRQLLEMGIYANKLIDYENPEVHKSPCSAAQIAIYASCFSWCKNAPEGLINAFYKSGLITTDEEYHLRQLIADKTILGDKKDGESNAGSSY